jgi:hypothetical protein
MTQSCAPGTSILDSYEAHSGLVTLVLIALAGASMQVAHAGYLIVAGGFYALAFVVASPLLVSELGALHAWLRA